MRQYTISLLVSLLIGSVCYIVGVATATRTIIDNTTIECSYLVPGEQFATEREGNGIYYAGKTDFFNCNPKVKRPYRFIGDSLIPNY